MINFSNFLKLTYRRTTLTGVEIREIFAEKVQSRDSIISNSETTAGLQRPCKFRVADRPAHLENDHSLWADQDSRVSVPASYY